MYYTIAAGSFFTVRREKKITRARIVLCRHNIRVYYTILLLLKLYYYHRRTAVAWASRVYRYVRRRVEFLLDFPGLQASSFSDRVARAASHVGPRRILLDSYQARARGVKRRKNCHSQVPSVPYSLADRVIIHCLFIFYSV